MKYRNGEFYIEVKVRNYFILDVCMVSQATMPKNLATRYYFITSCNLDNCESVIGLVSIDIQVFAKLR